MTTPAQNFLHPINFHAIPQDAVIGNKVHLLNSRSANPFLNEWIPNIPISWDDENTYSRVSLI